jgi:hypothetical protein
MGWTSELSNLFQSGNEPSEKAQVVRLRGNPTRLKVAIMAGADYIVVAGSILGELE